MIPSNTIERTAAQSRHAGRHLLDVFLAGVGLCALAPLFGLIAMAIKLDDGGPVFYLQARVGKHFQRFRVIKFRTMTPGADQKSALTASDDRRITRVGHFLRAYKLDELPQLLNVVRGDMQLVGARPEVPKYVEMFRADYEMILQQRPGITDPASIKYRSECDLLSSENPEEQYVRDILPQKIKLSLDYQSRRNLLSDLSLLFLTLSAVIPS